MVLVVALVYPLYVAAARSTYVPVPPCLVCSNSAIVPVPTPAFAVSIVTLALLLVVVPIPTLPVGSMRMRSAYTSAPTTPVNVPKVIPPAVIADMLPPPVCPPPTSSRPPPFVPRPLTTTVALPPSGFSAVLISMFDVVLSRMRSV